MREGQEDPRRNLGADLIILKIKCNPHESASGVSGARLPSSRISTIALCFTIESLSEWQISQISQRKNCLS